MNLKYTKMIAVIGIFILTFIFHFVYNWLPNDISAIFFPVNDSIWEHQKLIFTSIIIYGIIDYVILQKFKIKFNNFFTSLFISSLSSIPIFLTMYLPFYYKTGPKMFLNIGVMFIAIIISQIISYYILKTKPCDRVNFIFFILIIISYVIFAYLTYNPIKSELFFDTQDEKYGINNYNV